jgi:diguanylate cyclase (GGDEF)-like protein
MGIRSKILLAFILCVGTMAGISLAALQSSLFDSYDTIERNEIAGVSERMVQSVQTSVVGLKLYTHDWAVWNEMASYVLKPNADWEKDNLDMSVLDTGDLSVVMIYGPHGNLLKTIAHKKQMLALNVAALQDSFYVSVFKKGARETECGIVQSDAGLLLSCWAGIVRSDLSGEVVGTVVMGRLLDTDHVLKLRRQSGISFALKPAAQMPANVTRWPNSLSPNAIGGDAFFTAKEPGVYHLYFPLQDVLGQNVGMLTLDVMRTVHLQGQRLYQKVRNQLLWVVLIMTGVLALSLHFLLINRLRRFARQLIELADKSTWQTRIHIRGGDELGNVAANVNKLLGIIESQVEGLNALSLTDALTGLWNRRAFDARLEQECARERRNATPLALLMLDVDHFKRYNDRYGHPAGDAALQALAKIFSVAAGRAADMVARLGGEEFGILLPETDGAGALRIAAHIHQLLREAQIAHADSPTSALLTVSIGVVIVRDETPLAFVQRADLALYQAKHNGRNGSFFDDDIKKTIKEAPTLTSVR